MASSVLASGTSPTEGTSVVMFKNTHKYKGVTSTAMQTPEIYDALPNWKVRDDDIYLVTYPKSGTHWILEMVHLILNNLDVSKIDRSKMVYSLDFAVSSTIHNRNDLISGHRVMEMWPSPRVIMTHVLEEFCPPQMLDKKPKIIYLVRNPKDVLVSLYKFSEASLPEEVEGWNGFQSLFLSNEMFCGTWFRHVKGWWQHRNKPNMLICMYEDLQNDLRSNVKRIAEFIERPLLESDLDKMVELTTMRGMKTTYQQIEEDLGESGKAYTRLFGQLPHLRKGKVGNWKDQFTVADNELFDRVYKEQMEGYEIDVKFEI